MTGPAGRDTPFEKIDFGNSSYTEEEVGGVYQALDRRQFFKYVPQVAEEFETVGFGSFDQGKNWQRPWPPRWI